MFENLLKKKLTKSDKEIALEHITQKVSTMNLSEMRTFVRGKVESLPICEDGLNIVLKRLTLVDENSEKLYINSDDMDSKKKKAFDIVILIASSTLVNVVAVEYIQKFMEVYKKLIEEYDTQYKEIYMSRLTDAAMLTINTINIRSALNDKMSILRNK